VPREFLILSAPGGKCTVKEDGTPVGKEFGDTLGALAFIRRIAPGEAVKITFFNAVGQATMTRVLEPSKAT
jgi:hypothetical protein